MTVLVSNNINSQQFGSPLVMSESEAKDPRATIIADLDQDGLNDILSYSTDQLWIGWIRNMGNNSFAKHETIALTDSSFSRVLVADLDSNGEEDIIVVNGNNLFKISHVGQSNFSEPELFWSLPEDFGQSLFSDIAFVDLNQDSLLEIVYSYEISVNEGQLAYASNIDGFFEGHNSISTEKVREFQCVDLDANGVIDILARVGNNELKAYENQNMSFVEHEVASINSYYNSTAVLDYTDNGLPDVLYKNGRQMFVLSNSGNFSFSPSELVYTYEEAEIGPNSCFELSSSTVSTTNPFGCLPHGNCEESVDTTPPIVSCTGGVLTCVNTSANVTASAGIGASFSWTGPNGFTGSGSSVSATAPGTYTVTATYPNGCFSLSSCTVAYDPSTSTDCIGGTHLLSNRTFTIGDVNMDGLQDVIDNRFSWHINNGNGDFNFDYVEEGLAFLDARIEIGFLNEDAYPDILFSSLSGDYIGWIENTGEGSFNSPNYLVHSADDVSALKLEDIDSDGDTDCIASYRSRMRVELFDNNGLDFDKPIIILENVYDHLDHFDLSLVDIDADGLKDLICFPGNANEVKWYKNLDNEHFEDKGLLFDDLLITSLSAKDLNNDNLKDLFFSVNDIFYVALNNPLGLFDEPVPHEFTRISTGRCFEDFDGDGDIDIAIYYYESLNQTDFHIGIMENDGAGFFEIGDEKKFNNLRYTTVAPFHSEEDGSVQILAYTRFATNGMVPFLRLLSYDDSVEVQLRDSVTANFSHLGHLFPTDINGDGKEDILSLSLDKKMRWHQSVQDPSLTLSHDIAELVLWPTNFADVNLDGSPDVVATQPAKIVLFKNGNGLPISLFEIPECHGKDCINRSATWFPETSFYWMVDNAVVGEEVNFSLDQYSGEHEIGLIACNSAGCDTSFQSHNYIPLEINVPELAYANSPIEFNTESDGWTNWTWVFGDGGVSVEESTLHTYSLPGNYKVELIVTLNTIPDCTRRFQFEIQVLEEALQNEVFSVWPNPSKDLVNIYFVDDREYLTASLTDMKGEILHKLPIETKRVNTLDFSAYSPGIYFISIEKEGSIEATKKVVLVE